MVPRVRTRPVDVLPVSENRERETHNKKSGSGGREFEDSRRRQWILLSHQGRPLISAPAMKKPERRAITDRSVNSDGAGRLWWSLVFFYTHKGQLYPQGNGSTSGAVRWGTGDFNRQVHRYGNRSSWFIRPRKGPSVIGRGYTKCSG